MELPAADHRRRERYYNSEQGHHELHQNSSNSLPPSSSAASADVEEEEREYMFEKVVTPSDVGKLNRLVIPKQYAEHYFPLDPASNEKGGLLLGFEEEHTGRPWRFRYSYWNSSQSYVMTKGWSRFVKDKRLSAGDTVKFSRAASTGRLFIDWCHRLAPPDPPHLLRSSVVPWGWAAGLFFPPPSTSSAFASTSTINSASPMNYRSIDRPPMPPPVLLMGGRILDSVPMCAAEPKRVRLFGVNLDSCSEQNEDYPQPKESTVSTNHLPPPSPLQWRLSPTPAAPSGTELPQPPPAMDQD